MHVDNISIIRLQPLQSFFVLPDKGIFGGIGSETAGRFVPPQRHLGRDNQLVTGVFFPDHLAQHFLVIARLIDIGRVEVIYPHAHGLDHNARVVGGHHPEAYHGDLEAGAPQCPVGYVASFLQQ